MNIKQIKYELQNLISGESCASYDALIQTVVSQLRRGKRASPMAEEKHENKAQETKELIDFAKSNNLIIENIPEERFIASGAEQKVYITGGKYVIKLNDAIFLCCPSASFKRETGYLEYLLVTCILLFTFIKQMAKLVLGTTQK